MNKTLQAYVSRHQRDWDKFLLQAEASIRFVA
jgi:hypothetical protein